MPPKRNPNGNQPGPKVGSSRNRAWVFTYYPPTPGVRPEDVWCPVRSFDASAWIIFLCGQFEICPDTGRRHFQGYVYGRSPLGLKSVQRELGLPNVHCDARRGSHAEAEDYCTKEESRVPGTDAWRIGDGPRQGARTDLSHLKGVLDAHRSLAAAFTADFSSTVRFHRGLSAYLSTLGEPRHPDDSPEVHYYWGEADSGKTREAYRLAKERGTTLYPIPSSSGKVWFPGYVPGVHGVILLDDFTGQWPVNYFLTFVDRYPMTVEVKGGHTHIGRGAVIVITSNYPWTELYPLHPDPHAIRRRLTKVVHFSKLSNKKQKTSA